MTATDRPSDSLFERGRAHRFERGDRALGCGNRVPIGELSAAVAVAVALLSQH
jgi:hypothetical protein